jgi:hypothetical protein
MAIEDEIINITDIDVGTEILNNDKLIIETNNGTRLIAFKDLVIGEDNITFKDKLVQGASAPGGSTTTFSTVTGYKILTSDTTAGHATKYSDVSGSVELGKFNYDRVAAFAGLSAIITQNKTAIDEINTWKGQLDTTFADPKFASANLPAPTLSAVNFYYQDGSWDTSTHVVKFTSDSVVVNPTVTNKNVSVGLDPIKITYPASLSEGYVGSYILFQIDVEYRKGDTPILALDKISASNGSRSTVWSETLLIYRGLAKKSLTHIEYVSPGDSITLTSNLSIQKVKFKGFKLAS